MFSKIENELAEHFKSEAEHSMRKAPVAENAYAVACTQTDNSGIPWTAVYVDGGWNKRSYGHHYASSGAAVIIGQATRKVLFAGVRNKYCSIWANYDTDSASHLLQELEWIIVCNGSRHYCGRFQQRNEVPVFYCRWGHANILNMVHYGQDIHKIECIYHPIKNVDKKYSNVQTRVTVRTNISYQR